MPREAKKYIICFYASNYFRENRKDSTREQENRSPTNISSRRLWKAKKCSHAVDWFAKGLWYGPANLKSRMCENVQNIRQNHKYHQEQQGKLWSKSEKIRIKPSSSDNPNGLLPERFTLSFIICYCNGATQLYT